MAKRKVFKSTYEIVAEEAEARGFARGFARGLANALRKCILPFVKMTTLTDAEIAKGLDVEESLVKLIRQEDEAVRIK